MYVLVGANAIIASSSADERQQSYAVSGFQWHNHGMYVVNMYVCTVRT